MEELLKQIESKVAVIRHSIARNEKYRDFAHPSDISHYFRLLSLHIELGDWEAILKLVLKYKNSRCQVIEKQSVVFQSMIDLQKRSPGFVTQQTLYLMIEYMKLLEWKIDTLNGVPKFLIEEDVIQLKIACVTGRETLYLISFIVLAAVLAKYID